MVFESMGCEVVVEGASAVELAGIRALFEERDAVFSRFRPDSELNRVNATAGATLVSPLFARMVETALWARKATGGLVDPTVGAALEAAGTTATSQSWNRATNLLRLPRPDRSRCTDACSSCAAGST